MHGACGVPPSLGLPPLCACHFPGAMWLARQRACRGLLLFSFRRHLPATLRFFSCSAGCGAAPPPPAEPTHFMADYLRCSCGFSGAEARAASKHYAHLKSPERPDTVLRLLWQVGLGDADIKRAVQRCPRVLLARAERTVEPKIRALQGAGFSGPEVAQLISINPRILFYRDVVKRVEFWRKLLGTNRDLLRTTKKNPRILCYSLDNRVIPNLSLLRSLGIHEDKMRSLARMRPSLLSCNPDRTRTLVEQVKSLGIPPGTKGFAETLYTVYGVSRSTLDVKSKLLRSFGWTQADLVSAVRRFPVILRCSQKKLHAMMNFLVNEARCEPSYVARNPALLGYSMEKRLKPRFHVLQYLKTKGAAAGRMGLFSAMSINEDSFVKKYISPYSGKCPELLKTYHAVCAKNAEGNIASL